MRSRQSRVGKVRSAAGLRFARDTRRNVAPPIRCFIGRPPLNETMVSKSPTRRSKSRSPKSAHAHLPPGAIIMDIDKYGGRWIATRFGKVMAVADSYKELDKKVVELGIENEVIFTRVPTTGAFVY